MINKKISIINIMDPEIFKGKIVCKCCRNITTENIINKPVTIKEQSLFNKVNAIKQPIMIPKKIK